ncbi:unnamed protein product [Strongylus vulgaris]|uniref:Uncharacterized protein n=1 Tax=Strongylus vulgaris TaxID=40348 RepID=A0A3P7J846_STRVU|nr:unnamed protein product [Strongylus vulgaris]
MGCRLTRTESTELCEQTTTKEDEKQGNVSNGQPKAARKDTPIVGNEQLRVGFIYHFGKSENPGDEVIYTALDMDGHCERYMLIQVDPFRNGYSPNSSLTAKPIGNWRGSFTCDGNVFDISHNSHTIDFNDYFQRSRKRESSGFLPDVGC